MQAVTSPRSCACASGLPPIAPNASVRSAASLEPDDLLPDTVDQVGLELPAGAEARVELRAQERRREVVQAPAAVLPHDAQRAARAVLVAAAQHDVRGAAIAVDLDLRDVDADPAAARDAARPALDRQAALLAAVHARDEPGAERLSQRTTASFVVRPVCSASVICSADGSPLGRRPRSRASVAARSERRE